MIKLSRKYFTLSFLFFVFATANAQLKNDSARRIYPDSIVSVKTDKPAGTLNAAPDTIKVDTVKTAKFKPDPIRSIWLGAVIPGYGQIANRKYWKLPVVYGGFLGFAYAISWNNSRYTSYKNAYRDIIDNDPATNSFLDILPKGYEYVPNGGTLKDPTKIAYKQDYYTNVLKSKQESFRRYRDLSIILSIGYYGLVLLEAYVDAQLYDFDVSDDLTLNIFPTRIERERNSPSAYGLQCSIRF